MTENLPSCQQLRCTRSSVENLQTVPPAFPPFFTSTPLLSSPTLSSSSHHLTTIPFAQDAHPISHCSAVSLNSSNEVLSSSTEKLGSKFSHGLQFKKKEFDRVGEKLHQLNFCLCAKTTMQSVPFCSDTCIALNILRSIRRSDVPQMGHLNYWTNLIKSMRSPSSKDELIGDADTFHWLYIHSPKIQSLLHKKFRVRPFEQQGPSPVAPAQHRRQPMITWRDFGIAGTITQDKRKVEQELEAALEGMKCKKVDSGQKLGSAIQPSHSSHEAESEKGQSEVDIFFALLVQQENSQLCWACREALDNDQTLYCVQCNHLIHGRCCVSVNGESLLIQCSKCFKVAPWVTI